MFFVVPMRSDVRVEPSRLSVNTQAAVEAEIDAKYPNRVIPNTGLVISRHGCARIKDGRVSVADGGAVRHWAAFSLLVFCPQVGQVGTGHVRQSTSEGVYIQMGDFFQDIFVPGYYMLRPSRYGARRGLWVWEPEENDEDKDTGSSSSSAGSPTKKETDCAPVKSERVDVVPPDADVFEIEHGAEIRFKVVSVNFSAGTPRARSKRPRLEAAAQEEPEPVMSITASICEDGLGLMSWWLGDEDEEQASAESSVLAVNDGS